MDTPKTYEKLNRLGSVGLMVLLIIFVFLVAYIGLLPIGNFAGYKFELLDITENYPILEKLGQPLELLSDHFPPYESFLRFLQQLFFG